MQNCRNGYGSEVAARGRERGAMATALRLWLVLNGLTLSAGECNGWCDIHSRRDHCARGGCQGCDFCVEYENDLRTKACQPYDNRDGVTFECQQWCNPATAVLSVRAHLLAQRPTC